MGDSIRQRVWRLAWPLILSNLTVPLLGLVDTAILGHLPQPQYLGAVAISGIIFNMLLWSFAFLRMGTTALTAQALGAKDHSEAQLLLARSLILSTGLGLLIIVLRAPLFDLAFAYMSPGASVELHARIYCDIRIFAAPASLSNFVILGWLLAAGKARQVLFLAVLANLVNIVLDYLLVVEAGLLTDGVAYGSLIADYSALGVGILLVKRALSRMQPPHSYAELRSFGSYLPLLHLNRHIFLRTICLLFAFSFFYAQSAQRDDVTLSANAILITLLLVFAYGMDGFANAAEVLIGRAVGARETDSFYRTCRVTCGYFAGCTLLYLLVVGFSGDTIANLLTGLPAVVETTVQYWPWLLVVAAVSAWNFMFDGIFIGAAKGRAMQNTMLFSSFVVFVPVWYFSQTLGNHGLWLAFTSFHAARSLSMGIVFYYFSAKGQWLPDSHGEKRYAHP